MHLCFSLRIGFDRSELCYGKREYSRQAHCIMLSLGESNSKKGFRPDDENRIKTWLSPFVTRRF